MTRNRRTMVTAVVGDGTGGMQVVFFNQPWRETPAARGPAGRAVRQGRRVPGRAADDEPDRRPDRRPHRAHRADLPAEREGAAQRRGRSPAGSRTRCERCRAAASPTRCPTAIRTPARPDRPRRRAARRSTSPRRCARRSRPAGGWRSTSCCGCSSCSCMRKRAARARRRGASRHTVDGELVRRFHDALPYPLTGAQLRVIAEIERRPRRAASRCTGCCRATSARARRWSPCRRC